MKPCTPKITHLECVPLVMTAYRAKHKAENCISRQQRMTTRWACSFMVRSLQSQKTCWALRWTLETYKNYIVLVLPWNSFCGYHISSLFWTRTVLTFLVWTIALWRNWSMRNCQFVIIYTFHSLLVSYTVGSGGLECWPLLAIFSIPRGQAARCSFTHFIFSI